MKSMRLSYVFLTVFLGLQAVGADETDTIIIKNNIRDGEIGFWISETTSDGPKTTTKIVVPTEEGQQISNTYSGKPGAIIAFGKDRAPTLEPDIDWSGGQTVTLSLNNTISLPLHFWVASGQFSEVSKVIEHAVAVAKFIFAREKQGIILVLPEGNITDVTNVQGADRYNRVGQAFQCPQPTIGEDLKIGNAPSFDTEAVNIYFVASVMDHGVESTTSGEYCSFPHPIIAIGTGGISQDRGDVAHMGGLLAHELGHFLGLGHTGNIFDEHNVMIFDERNVMHPQSTTRAFLTEGQTFRALYHPGSKLPSSGRQTVPCDSTIGTPTSTNCPPLDLRIWEDKL